MKPSLSKTAPAQFCDISITCEAGGDRQSTPQFPRPESRIPVAVAVWLVFRTEKPIAVTVLSAFGTEKPIAVTVLSALGTEKPIAVTVLSVFGTEKLIAVAVGLAFGTEKLIAVAVGPAFGTEKLVRNSRFLKSERWLADDTRVGSAHKSHERVRSRIFAA
ncbi:MAG TPA: hypothetical protein VFQ05_07605 [Candidatus Eisenbacteria bacterium]|nr:hypothetical protein [Candidatus Eisenbacteria bacterium]